MPLVSMTGFGTCSRPWDGSEGGGHLEVEVRSVNARFLEVKLRQPFGVGVEADLRRLVERQVQRGRVDLSVFVRSELAEGADALGRLGVDPVRLRETLVGLRRVGEAAREESLEIGQPNALELLRFVQSSTRSTGEPVPPSFLQEAVEEALARLQAFRLREGAALAAVLAELGDTLEAQVDALAATLPAERERLSTLVRQRLAEWESTLSAPGLDSERILQEVAVLLARGDVAEEVARIACHLGQLRETLDIEPVQGQGKTLEFLSQELLREVTTIGSKITSHEGSRLVIEAKGTIERIREQVQNVQ